MGEERGSWHDASNIPYVQQVGVSMHVCELRCRTDQLRHGFLSAQSACECVENEIAFSHGYKMDKDVSRLRTWETLR